MDLEELKSAVEAFEGLREMHHIHVWQPDEERVALEAHLVIEDGGLTALVRIKGEAKALLSECYGIGHSTLEFEAASEVCDDQAHSGYLWGKIGDSLTDS